MPLGLLLWERLAIPGPRYPEVGTKRPSYIVESTAEYCLFVSRVCRQQFRIGILMEEYLFPKSNPKAHIHTGEDLS